MNTFNIKNYIAEVISTKLSLLADYDFTQTEVAGIDSLEGVLQGSTSFDNFIATDSTGDGYIMQNQNGGYFLKRVATVYILRKYNYGDTNDMLSQMEKCRKYFKKIVRQMVNDQPNLANRLVYLNTERIAFREFEKEVSTHFTGLYFMLQFEQPYDLLEN